MSGVIPVELDEDQIKAAVLDTCKSPLEMDIAQMRRSLKRWGFKIEDYEQLSDGAPYVLQEYMVWLQSHREIELARVFIEGWLQCLPEFPWVGKWDFVVKYARTVNEQADFTVRVTRYVGHVYRIDGCIRSNIHVRWPNQWKQIVADTAWQRL